MTNELIDNLDATGHGGKSIVMGKDPVPKPPILRGRIAIHQNRVTKVNNDGSMDFSIMEVGDPRGDCIVSYHGVDPTGDICTAGVVSLEVLPTTVVTWDWVKPA